MFWGQTEAIPIDQGTAVSTDENTAVAETQENGRPAAAATTPLPVTTGPPAASVATLPADKSEKNGEMVAAAAAEESKSTPKEPRSNTASPRTPFQQPISSDMKHAGRGGQGSSAGGASRRRGDRRRQKPTVVREVRLVRGYSRTAAAAAALLLADGSVWWVSDLQVGSWQQVTVSAGGAAAADGVTAEGCLSSSGISAIAVVGLPGQSHAEENPTFGSDSGEKFVTGRKANGGCGRGGVRAISEVAIVAGRDDGWLFLLTQSRSPPTVISKANHDVKPADGGGGDRAVSPPRPWRISAAWEGHRSRVTAVWVVGDAAQSRLLIAPEGGPQGFTAALDTSRLFSSSSSGGHGCDQLYGALVSAGADGTVAWWEWARADHAEDVVDDGNPSSCRKSGGEMTIRAPRLRMVSRITVTLRECNIECFYYGPVYV